MTNPITPPPELVQQWRQQSVNDPTEAFSQTITNLAAQWGADQELEACCEWFTNKFGLEVAADIADLRAARRPKPPNLKEQALNLLAKTNGPIMLGNPEYRLRESEVETIRRALEALPDD